MDEIYKMFLLLKAIEVKELNDQRNNKRPDFPCWKVGDSDKRRFAGGTGFIGHAYCQ